MIANPAAEPRPYSDLFWPELIIDPPPKGAQQPRDPDGPELEDDPPLEPPPPPRVRIVAARRVLRRRSWS